MDNNWLVTQQHNAHKPPITEVHKIKTTFIKVIPTTSPLLGADLLKASMDTISASTATREAEVNKSSRLLAKPTFQKAIKMISLFVLTWYVRELYLFGDGSYFVLEVLVLEAHHFALEGGGQQLLPAGLTEAVDVALRGEPGEAVLHEGKLVSLVTLHPSSV